MSPRAARIGLAVAAILSAGTLALLAPRWLEPIPEADEILRRIEKRDFAAANDLIRSFLRAREEEPVARLFRSFPSREVAPPGSPVPAALAQRAVVLAPRDRVYGERAAILFFDGSGDAASRSYFARVDAEGRERRGFGPSGPGATLLPLVEGDLLGPPGAAGLSHLSSSGKQLDSAAFEVLPPERHALLGLRLRVADHLAGGSDTVRRYLRAMTLFNERCYADALTEIEPLLRADAANPVLGGAWVSCLEGMGLGEFASAPLR